MIDLGLSAAERDSLDWQLRHSHDMRIDVRLLDQNEKPIAGIITDRVVSGAVQVDTTQEDAPTRQLTLELVDKGGKLDILPTHAGDLGLFADIFIRVNVEIYVNDLGDWVPIPVFQGPLSHAERAGKSVHLEGLGKEVLALDPYMLWEPMAIHHGTRTVDAIRRIMAAQGEALFDLPEIPHKLNHTVSLERHALPWHVATHLAKGLDRQLFYDGRGRLRLRAPTNRLWSFKAGENADVMSRPKVIYDLSEVRNLVELTGPKIDGPKKRLRAVARPNPSHPLSPESLKRNGERRYMVDAEDVSHAKRQYLLNARARHKLDDLLEASVSVSFEALPIIHLEELDRVAVATEGRIFEFRLQQFTIPLTCDSTMTVGSLQRVSAQRKVKKHR
jgi:hypothetical protein